MSFAGRLSVVRFYAYAVAQATIRCSHGGGMAGQVPGLQVIGPAQQVGNRLRTGRSRCFCSNVVHVDSRQQNQGS